MKKALLLKRLPNPSPLKGCFSADLFGSKQHSGDWSQQKRCSLSFVLSFSEREGDGEKEKAVRDKFRNIRYLSCYLVPGGSHHTRQAQKFLPPPIADWKTLSLFSLPPTTIPPAEGFVRNNYRLFRWTIVMSILLIKTSSRAISGTLSSDFTFYHWKACPARFRRLFFFFGGSTSRDNLFDKSA